MPNIEPSDRAKFDPGLSRLSEAIYIQGVSNGELNYLMTKMALMYLTRHGTSYNTLSDESKPSSARSWNFIAVMWHLTKTRRLSKTETCCDS